MTNQFDEILLRALADMNKPKRRKCFISYYHGDQAAVDKFVESFEDVLIAKAIGISEEDDYINSDDPEYVMSRIRSEVLEDSTISICLIGQCTHSRRYVDWELKASLRQGDAFEPNGLIGILLPHMEDKGHLPDRLKANWSTDEGKSYALYRSYPRDAKELRDWIENAYSRRTSHKHLISNSQDMMKYNSRCLVHSVTH